MTKVVKNQSQGYGYHYASLADFARQGIEIPQMITKLVDGVEYVYYKQGDEWLQGARVITHFESKGMNAAQAYGSALTYARRYTVAMANAIATDDDDEVEKAKPVAKKSYEKIDFDEVRKNIRNAETVDELETIYKNVPAKLQQYFVDDCAKRKAEL